MMYTKQRVCTLSFACALAVKYIIFKCAIVRREIYADLYFYITNTYCTVHKSSPGLMFWKITPQDYYISFDSLQIKRE